MPDQDQLYELLPAIIRLRDTAQGEPLRAVLRVIGERYTQLERDIGRIYANQFIETCEPWVIPYIGELVGYRPLHASPTLGPLDDQRAIARAALITPRSDVANTIAYRRRKGTLSVLVDLALAVSGWAARVSEPRRGHVRIDVCRLRAFLLTHVRPFCLPRRTTCYTFSVLGNDSQLFAQSRPADQSGSTQLPEGLDRPTLRRNLARLYGNGQSLCIYENMSPVAERRIIVSDLGDWTVEPDELQSWEQHNPKRNDWVAIDPLLGRFMLPERYRPTRLTVSYNYGFTSPIGGGEYPRLRPIPPCTNATSSALTCVTAEPDKQVILEAIRHFQSQAEPPKEIIIELCDSGLYVEPVVITLEEGQTLVLRAADGCRPTLVLPERSADVDDMVITCGRGARIILDGLMIARRPVRIVGAPAEVILRDCTLVPGWELDAQCTPTYGAEPSLILSDIPLAETDDATATEIEQQLPARPIQVRIEHSIIGSIVVERDEVCLEPIDMTITDSIIDATDRQFDAISAPQGRIAQTGLTIQRCTVIGVIKTHVLHLAENTIFAGLLEVARRQIGCLRFCAIENGSRTPRRYACQPDRAREAEPQAEVRPQFQSERYGYHGYLRLVSDQQLELRWGDGTFVDDDPQVLLWRGADDESEMGVYHDEYAPQRSDNLRARLAEYIPLEALATIRFLN
jgi:hypothetical protein